MLLLLYTGNRSFSLVSQFHFELALSAASSVHFLVFHLGFVTAFDADSAEGGNAQSEIRLPCSKFSCLTV